MEDFHLVTSKKSHLSSHVAIINAWIKFSAVRFCSDVPDIRAMRSPLDDLESEISINAPDIWTTNKQECYILITQKSLITKE